MSAPETPPPAVRPLRDALRLGAKALSVAAVCAVAVAAIVTFIPEGNDYAEATILKHNRLNSFDGPRIVLVGGSNLAFGIDSQMMQRETACPVVNMGMNGYFGVRYMLEEVRPALRRGDTVVVALEYDSFFKSVEGTASNLFVIVKANPEGVNYLTWRQRLAVLGATPYIAQEKLLRLIRGVAFGLRDAIAGEGDDAATIEEMTSQIETLSGFNAEGDLVSHLGVDWPFEHEPGIDPSTPVDPEIIGLLRSFDADMQARGVRVMISYTPLLRDFYVQHQAGIDNVHRLITEAGLTAPAPPADYVYDESFFFDTVFHVNAEGRTLRTERLAADINTFRGPDASCNPALQLTDNGARAQ
jgi:hypothetical protein